MWSHFSKKAIQMRVVPVNDQLWQDQVGFAGAFIPS